MNDNQRAEFESKFAEPWALENEVGKWKDNEGNYIYSQLDIAWKAWQAAISSMVVELPALITDEYENGETLEYVEMSELKESLDKAGIRYE